MNVGEVGECYEKNAEALVRFAASIVGPASADDVVSAAVLSVLNRQSSREVVVLQSYLYRAVANAGAKHWRSTDRRGRREQAFARPDYVEDPSHSRPDDTIRVALGGLSPQQRSVIHLTYWEDLTPKAIADRLGVSDGSVRRQLARARHKLREVLDGYER